MYACMFVCVCVCVCVYKRRKSKRDKGWVMTCVNSVEADRLWRMGVTKEACHSCNKAVIAATKLS
jgi:hypothetical protein